MTLLSMASGATIHHVVVFPLRFVGRGQALVVRPGVPARHAPLWPSLARPVWHQPGGLPPRASVRQCPNDCHRTCPRCRVPLRSMRCTCLALAVMILCMHHNIMGDGGHRHWQAHVLEMYDQEYLVTTHIARSANTHTKKTFVAEALRMLAKQGIAVLLRFSVFFSARPDVCCARFLSQRRFILIYGPPAGRKGAAAEEKSSVM